MRPIWLKPGDRIGMSKIGECSKDVLEAEFTSVLAYELQNMLCAHTDFWIIIRLLESGLVARGIYDLLREYENAKIEKIAKRLCEQLHVEGEPNYNLESPWNLDGIIEKIKEKYNIDQPRGDLNGD